MKEQTHKKQNVIETLLAKKFGILETPAQTFEKCMSALANAKNNLKEQQGQGASDPEFFKNFENFVNLLIEGINDNLEIDIDEKIWENLIPLFEQDRSSFRGKNQEQKQGFK